jgi:WbqC-like protein
MIDIICAIHQPNFFPWLAYFDKIRHSDIFIFLDNADYPKSGSGSGSWVNRVQIDIKGQPAWFGCPIKRKEGRWKIIETNTDDKTRWRKKLKNTLYYNYIKFPLYRNVMSFIEPILMNPHESLADYNIHGIKCIADYLGLSCNFIRASSLDIDSSSTQRLIDLTKAVGANTYLCGGGAQGYQEDTLFLKNGLQLKYQNFTPKPYGKQEQYIPGLSVIDYLMKREEDDTW